jgi:membrane protein YdbS with pleckstrin-like domain
MPDVFNAPAAKFPPKKVMKSTPGGALSMFMVRPKNITFETQEDDEEIILFLRQHYIVNAGWVFATLVLLFVPTILGPLMLTSNLIPPGIPGGYFVVIPLIWYLGLFGFALINFLQWYYNVYIVTNERVVDVDWLNLLYKKLSTTQLGRIQDVTYKQGGLLDLFFDYGDVFIQTAGTEQNFEFEKVPQPQSVVRAIDELIEERKV